MKIQEILEEDLVNPSLFAKDKKGVLEELSELLAVRYKEIDKAQLLEVLLEREKLGTTGIEDGVAIPHAKLKNLHKVVIAFGRSMKGVDFQSVDGKLTNLIFLLVAPEDTAGTHLKTLARLSRLLKDASFRKKLLEAKDRKELYKVILQEDEKF